jgi:hypothetical protein
MQMAELDAHATTPTVDPITGQSNGPGRLVLTFDQPIGNGPGADFACFENGFVSNYNTGAGSVVGQMFAELGFVEVSSDGEYYAQFPSIYLNYPDASLSGVTDSRVDLDGNGALNNIAYLTQDVSNVYNLAGKHANAYGISWGTPFNLDDLLTDPLVLSGLVDLNDINYVRIVDIPGNGTFTDSQGNPIFDAWVTWGSGGMDFEALGVINWAQDGGPGTVIPEPTSIALFGAGVIGLALRVRKRSSATT